MGKLGAFSYPEISLEEAVGVVKLIATRMKGQVVRRGVAVALNQSEASGWLSHKLAALRDFGLAEGRGEGHLTLLAQHLAFPTDEEELARAKREAYANVALFRLLEGRFQGEVPPPAALTVALEEITDTPRHQVVRRVALIRGHLADWEALRRKPSPAEVAERLTQSLARQGIASAEARSKPVPEAPQGKAPVEAPQGQAEGPKKPTTLEINVGEVRMSAPLSNETLDIAISLLQGLRRR